MSEINHRYAVLRTQLDELGYMQPLPKDAIRLVDKLLGDLVQTTESLQYYKALSNSLTNERDTLLIGTQPYKCDNAKLVCQINSLNLEIIKLKEEHDYQQKKLENEIQTLHTVNNNLETDKKLLQGKLRELELECAEQASEILQLSGIKGKSKIPTSRTVSKSRSVSKHSALKTDSGISLSEKGSLLDLSKLTKKCNDLENDVQQLAASKQQQLEMINSFKKQIQVRDQEIIRLTDMLRGGRPVIALDRDCCHKNENFKRMEFKTLTNETLQLEGLLDEAVNKQHEAMTRNLALMERNKQLEKELHEIDQIALNVEKQCNENIEQKKMMIQNLQDKYNSSLDRNRDLERQLMNVRSENEELLGECRLFKKRGHSISRYVQTANVEDDYHRSSELVMKIDELTDNNTKLQQKIKELEERLHDILKQEKSRSISPIMIPTSDTRYDCSMGSHRSTSYEHHCLCKRDFDVHCYASNPTSNTPRHAQHTIASFKKSTSNFPYKHEIKSPFCKDECICNKCFQSISNLINRLEREKDVMKSDINHLEAERDCLQERLRTATEIQISEHSRLKHAAMESQNRVARLEQEQRDLIQIRGDQEGIIRNLEQQCSELKEKLCLQEKDTSHHRILYNQLKILHDQTGRSFSTTQKQLTDAENQLAISLERTHTLEQERVNLEEECKITKLDLLNAKSSLDRNSKEVHDLRNEVEKKAEELEKNHSETRLKNLEILQLRKTVEDLNRRLEEASREKDRVQHILSDTSGDVDTLRKEIASMRLDCEHYSHENRRLQDELTSATCDLRSALRDLESSRKESADLQQQLQQYVARVRHAEDIITMKETERSELLEQFRSLSHEATILENNNHTLESKAADSRMRLHATGQHAEDLQMRIQEKEASLNIAEEEIAGLRSRITTLEAESDHYKQSLRRCNDDLTTLRELCVDLDKQKDGLAHESGRLHTDRCQTERVIDELRSERDCLQQDLDRESSAKLGLESLLETSRREAIDQRLLVQELNREVGELRNKVQELLSKLETEREQVRRYQAQSHEYSVQLQELRRQITSERYRATQADEDRAYFTTL